MKIRKNIVQDQVAVLERVPEVARRAGERLFVMRVPGHRPRQPHRADPRPLVVVALPAGDVRVDDADAVHGPQRVPEDFDREGMAGVNNLLISSRS